MNEKRVVTKPGELAAKEADIFAGGPGVDDFGRIAVGENAIPIAVHPVESMDRIILFPEGGATIEIFRDGDGRGMTCRGKLVGEIVHVDSAVRAEVVVKSEENITHGSEGCNRRVPSLDS